MSEINYKIIDRIAILSETRGGWTKELNKVSWNNRPEKFDLRDWNHAEETMRKGITLSDEEMRNLKEVLNNINI